jgi:hypothetical protein
VYALLLAALAVMSGLRSGPASGVDDGRSRLDRAAMWLGLLNLASFAGPFVGGAYGAVGTSWLVALRAAGGETAARRRAWIAALVATFVVPWLTPSPGSVVPPDPGMLVLSAAWQIWAIAVNVWAAWPRRTAYTPTAVAAAAAA